MARKNNSKTTNRKITNGKKQTFSITAPIARSVQLVGDFTHWTEQPIALRKEGNGVWQVTVELKPGEHHYRFLVDGQWHDDPACALRAPNPYGEQNAVRKVA